MTAILRIATSEDAELLCAVGARLFEQTFGPHNSAGNMAEYLAHAFTPEKWRAELADANRRVWIASDAGADVGYVSLYRGTRSDGVTGDRPAEIERIYADRSMHGTGLGQTLMRTCVEHATSEWNADELWLAVWQLNPRAIAFYEKTGFRKVGRQTFQLGSELQHDFVMARFLTS